MKRIHRYFHYVIISGLYLFIISCSSTKTSLHGNESFSDAVHKRGIQIIPGRLQCELYDIGGEGIAYHDTDSVNKGSGALNKGNDYLSTFRKHESVDVSFTKYHDSIDNSIYNLILPKEGQLYLGWTEPGEWTKYTINVTESGTYQIGLMYTANQNGQISIKSKNQTSGLLNVESTFHKDDPIAWRQWHHWNFAENLGRIKLKKGIQIIYPYTESIGQMNYDFIEFALTKP